MRRNKECHYSSRYAEGSAQRIVVVSQIALYADGCAPVGVVVFAVLKGQDGNAVAGPQRFDEGIGSAAN